MRTPIEIKAEELLHESLRQIWQDYNRIVEPAKKSRQEAIDKAYMEFLRAIDKGS